jgi:hypothetical protein
MRNTATSDGEHKLLTEIGKLAEKLRVLRSTGAMRNEAQIKTLTAQLRQKWEEVRAARAPGPIGDMTSRGRGPLG